MKMKIALALMALFPLVAESSSAQTFTDLGPATGSPFTRITQDGAFALSQHPGSTEECRVHDIYAGTSIDFNFQNRSGWDIRSLTGATGWQVLSRTGIIINDIDTSGPINIGTHSSAPIGCADFTGVDQAGCGDPCQCQ